MIEGTYVHRGRFPTVYIAIPNSSYRASCWVINNHWVTDDGHVGFLFGLSEQKRKYKSVRKVDFSLPEDKRQYALLRHLEQLQG